LWAKELNAKDIHEDIFSVHCGKCLSRKAVHNWLTKVSLMTKRLRRSAEVVEITVTKDFYAAGFDALVKRWDKCINVGGEYVEK
jgi:hypothetical protein